MGNKPESLHFASVAFFFKYKEKFFFYNSYFTRVYMEYAGGGGANFRNLVKVAGGMSNHTTSHMHRIN
jgi:hypothetical protein